MLFNSFNFLLFFPIVTILYFLSPHRYRWLLLLIASCVFYMFFKAIYILILFFTIITDYYAGILIERATELKKRKRFLLLSLIANIGVLAVFKYYNFINENISGLYNLFGSNNPIPHLNILLPIGLSFHTFQAMSYTIEVYRGNQKAERNFGIYSLYVMFYPQLVAGPIERPQNLLHQFYEQHKFDYNNVTDGLKQMVWGFFKKMVVADRLGVLVDTVYGDLTHHSGVPLLMAVFFFAFQVYCDFSGYSDIAIGAARVMGIKLMTNFNRPLSSTSISELWRRWHISLSSWINDYLYTPVSISFRNWEKRGIVLALMISFTLIGLWHGASWNFVIYGSIHGVYVSYEILTKKIRKKWSKKIPKYLYNQISKLIVVSLFSFSLIFFRAKDFSQAKYIITHLFKNLSLRMSDYNIGLDKLQLIIAIFGICIVEIFHYLQGKGVTLITLNEQPTYIRWLIYYLLLGSVIILANPTSNQFIYFQF
jgi:alginate O-acetyltransferase complex protein AlgI